MNDIRLSYVVATYNKLPYLRTSLESLIEAKKTDEEIIVIDGGSEDGTPEYLALQLKAGFIEYYESSRDKGESHAFNKAIVQARGDLIKLITDDDVFYYPGIQDMKEFMLSHPEIDFLNTNGIKHRKEGGKDLFSVTEYEKEFENWKISHRPFSSCGLGIMFRRSSVSLFGMLDTSVVRSDAEFTLRTTAGKATVAWYTLPCYVRILNQQSNTTKQASRYYEDTERLNLIYFGKRPTLVARARKILKSLHTAIFSARSRQNIDGTSFSYDEWKPGFVRGKQWLESYAAVHTGNFLWKI